MKFKYIQLLIIIAALALSQFGCASKGFHRGDLRQQLGVISPEVTDEEIAKALARKPNLPKPFKLAVYFRAPTWSYRSTNAWRWSQEDKDLIEQATQDLKKENLLANVYPIVGSTVMKDDLKSIRMAAARHGADAVLVVSGASEVDKYTNALGWSYALILPLMFMPASKADTLFISNATLWDVRNEFLYLTAEAEATSSETYIAAYGRQNKERIHDVKSKAMKRLKDQLVAMIRGQNLAENK